MSECIQKAIYYVNDLDSMRFNQQIAYVVRAAMDVFCFVFNAWLSMQRVDCELIAQFECNQKPKSGKFQL